MVSPSEGNEVRRDGRQGVAVPHSSVEAGERALPDPVERRGCRVVDGELEPRRGHRASPACHRETTQSCEGQRFHNVTNRMHLTCTSGSVGDLGGRPPRSTRPSVRASHRGVSRYHQSPCPVGDRLSLEIAGRYGPHQPRSLVLLLRSTYWQTDRMVRLGHVDLHCVGLFPHPPVPPPVMGAPPAPPAVPPPLSEAFLQGYVMLLSGHFQGFCRDLYTECSQVLIEAVPANLKATVQFQFATELRLRPPDLRDFALAPDWTLWGRQRSSRSA